MPTVHLPKDLNEKLDDLYVRLVTESQQKLKRTRVVEIAFAKGIDNVTVADVIRKDLEN